MMWGLAAKYAGYVAGFHLSEGERYFPIELDRQQVLKPRDLRRMLPAPFGTVAVRKVAPHTEGGYEAKGQVLIFVGVDEANACRYQFFNPATKRVVSSNDVASWEADKTLSLEDIPENIVHLVENVTLNRLIQQIEPSNADILADLMDDARDEADPLPDLEEETGDGIINVGNGEDLDEPGNGGVGDQQEAVPIVAETDSGDAIQPEAPRRSTRCSLATRLETGSVLNNSLMRTMHGDSVLGYNQREGVDYHQVYAAIPRQTTWKIVVATAVQLDMQLRQYDVAGAFLESEIDSIVIVRLPPELRKFDHEGNELMCVLDTRTLARTFWVLSPTG
eukprot:m.128454 g.128454  ORF g.128454 m.128454 type:complete len:334 (-) comp11238_c0_seq2:450-1451(-)